MTSELIVSNEKPGETKACIKCPDCNSKEARWGEIHAQEDGSHTFVCQSGHTKVVKKIRGRWKIK